jgi:hypothetical protein
MSATSERPRARSDIDKDEQWTPAFVLFDVDTFVRTCHDQRSGRASKDDVPEGHRLGPAV